MNCESWEDPKCLCQSHPSSHLRLRGLCAKSMIDKHYQPHNNFSDFGRLQLVGHKTRSTIGYDEKSKNWKLSLAGSDVSGNSNALHQAFLLGKQNWSIKTPCISLKEIYLLLVEETLAQFCNILRCNLYEENFGCPNVAKVRNVNKLIQQGPKVPRSGFQKWSFL